MLFAGTERGVYVTFDDGGRWAPLQNNLPHAPIAWIAVQLHFHDLVVATYGRGIWILDDISPLEDPALSGGAMTGGAMLFKPRPAYRFRSQQGIASAPNSAVRVDSVPEGADLTYYLPAALADTAAAPDRPHAPARHVGPRSVATRAAGTAGHLPGAPHGRGQRGERSDTHPIAHGAQGPQHRRERRGRRGTDPPGARHPRRPRQRGADDQPARVGAETARGLERSAAGRHRAQR